VLDALLDESLAGREARVELELRHLAAFDGALEEVDLRDAEVRRRRRALGFGGQLALIGGDPTRRSAKLSSVER
jgi:hypothetical protein